jgi:CRP-like cAMP-binding protein
VTGSPEQYDAALSEVRIFRSLTEEDRKAVARRCTWHHIARREHVISHLEASTDVFFVVQGRLRAVNISPSGKEVACADIEPGELFGEFAAIDGAARSANVIAITDAFIGALPADEFRRVLETHASVANAVLRRLTRHIRMLNERIYEFSTLAVKNRIHAELLRLALNRVDPAAPDASCRISPAPTHAEIASRISTHREAVTREMNALARAGIVEKTRKALVVHDLPWLQHAVAMELGDFAPPLVC